MPPVKRIKKIEINQVKGISNTIFDVELIPNKPTILVAPNGFGKSSFAVAFHSLRPSKLEIEDEHAHNGNAGAMPEIVITSTMDDGSEETLTANSGMNEISAAFSVYVIRSALKPRARVHKIQGNSIATASINVPDIELIGKIPPKHPLVYSYTESKQTFGSNGKAIPNISDVLKDVKLMLKIAQVDFSKEDRTGTRSSIARFRNHVNSRSGTTAQIIAAVDTAEIELLRQIDHIREIADIVKEFDTGKFGNQVNALCAAIQICELHKEKKEEFKACIKHFSYLHDKEYYVTKLKPLKATWKNIAPVEADNRLVLRFPLANQISNGERDTLCLVAELLRARRQLKKDRCILVIDEVFDYLDDANLVACQYHLTQMIPQWKQEGRQLFPLILTHLDPSYFNNFTFKDQKVVYLSRYNKCPETYVKEMILRRHDASIETDISKFFLHFHPSDRDLSAKFHTLGLYFEISTANKFNAYVKTQLDRYISKRNYDPISVCCAVRNALERAVYQKLDTADKPAFLDIHKTRDKLDWALEKGIDLPEQFFLLAVIYNEAVHIKSHRDALTPLFSKLENLTIRHMIEEVMKFCAETESHFAPPPAIPLPTPSSATVVAV
ncbi:ABC transporter ATP-binding protein [Methylocystis bryophila]|uniref:Uncharacterized protein n=1 Tax=Methylocystis bryophila TaxID=655015 RepID=A0A1W6MW34_9HYPH|nr:ABC transporter ATP-binding protein [Methylocystis bryophila]ARN81803.1 hypothetical protein B1812_12750 [Methylocystis bryophila]BDV37869.1 hypothetical protein DSM21852_11220 [Methylocystis bryophila]